MLGGTAVVLGRALSVAEVGGVLLIAAGVVLVRGLRGGAEGVGVSIAIGVTIATYTLIDKEGLRHAAPIPYLELVLAPLAVLALAARPRALQVQLSWSTVGAAAGSFGSYALFLFALRLTAAPGVAAVRETSLVIGAALASIVLREHVSWPRFL
ncbi:MAG: hypothetical protein ACRDLK_05080, partial [Gaiellaceae bacterium]